MWLSLSWFMFVAWAITLEKVVYDGNSPADGNSPVSWYTSNGVYALATAKI